MPGDLFFCLEKDRTQYSCKTGARLLYRIKMISFNTIGYIITEGI